MARSLNNEKSMPNIYQNRFKHYHAKLVELFNETSWTTIKEYNKAGLSVQYQEEFQFKHAHILKMVKIHENKET